MILSSQDDLNITEFTQGELWIINLVNHIIQPISITKHWKTRSLILMMSSSSVQTLKFANKLTPIKNKNI